MAKGLAKAPPCIRKICKPPIHGKFFMVFRDFFGEVFQV